jgi:hypothetical protein
MSIRKIAFGVMVASLKLYMQLINRDASVVQRG